MQIFVGMAASQPNKATMKWVDDSDEEDDRPGWLEVGLRKVREQDAGEREWEKNFEEQAERARKEKMNFEYLMYQCREKRKIEEAAEQRKKDFIERSRKNFEVEDAKREREKKIFRERVLYEARLGREKEEEEECTSKRKEKGKGPWSTQ